MDYSAWTSKETDAEERAACGTLIEEACRIGRAAAFAGLSDNQLRGLLDAGAFTIDTSLLDRFDHLGWDASTVGAFFDCIARDSRDIPRHWSRV